MVNQKEFRVIGMSRSGNHAIINWICRQTEGRTCFLNCAEPRSNPFTSARLLDHGRLYEVNYLGFDLKREQRGRFSAKDLLIFSHEDVFLGTLTSGDFEENHDQMVGRSGTRLDLLILRDPFNLFASRLKSEHPFLISRTAMRIWKQHAREFLSSRYFNQSLVCINYNRWVSSRSYRQDLANRLGLRFNDAAAREIPQCAGGSSFDHRRLHGQAKSMRVFSRWRAFSKDAFYWQLFDEEAIHFAHEVFGASPTLAAASARKRCLARLQSRQNTPVGGTNK